MTEIKLFKPPTAIVYSKDFEPISHIPMTAAMYEYFMTYEVVRFPLNAKITLAPEGSNLAPELVYAEISAMRVQSLDGVRLILIARNEETVLLMNNSFLPGQTKEINFMKNVAFFEGMAKAIRENKKK